MSLLLKHFGPIILKIIESLLTDEYIKKYGDKLFDLVEDAVIDSDTKWDDKIVLPIINALRAGLHIPDND